MTVASHSLEETRQMAQNFAKDLLKPREKLGVAPRVPSAQALVIALEGELGAGKTTFTQSLARALGLKQNITSPTFVLMKQYSLDPHSGFKSLIHIDAYRTKDYRDLNSLGIAELMANPDNLILIEWPERVQEILPEHRITIHIDHIDETTRAITITNIT